MPAVSLTTAQHRYQFARRGLVVLGICSTVSLSMALAAGKPIVPHVVYSVCIGLGCWLFVDGGRLSLARWVHRRDAPDAPSWHKEWPGFPWMVAVVSLGTLAGYTLGNEVADRIIGDFGHHTSNFEGASFTAMVLVSMIPSIAITYFFYTRGRLAGTLADAQRLATEQRLKLLASQLEPHMLFNTLANLRALIALDPLRAQAMLDRLILFLRATLDASRTTTHPLASEFARLADYLELMQIRMGSRLQTQLTLPDDLAALPVPTLLLQPLVENAIKHGLEPHVEGGRVEVSAAREGAQLVLRVRDTGAGLAAASPQAGAGFGLEQVRERLAALYGATASCELAPAADADGGTLATLRLPL